MKDDELLSSIFGVAHPLRESCAGWIAASRPFRAFVEVNAAKIRRKLREAGEDAQVRDVALELDVAFHLLSDRRVALAYEKYLAQKARGPDFTATFKGHFVFNVEVRRLRTLTGENKLADVICEKLRQMPPAAINVLVVGVDECAGADLDLLDLTGAMKRLIQRAEAKQEGYFAERGFHDARDFLRDLLRVSGVMLRVNWSDPASTTAVLWSNPQARHPLPADVQKLLRW